MPRKGQTRDPERPSIATTASEALRLFEGRSSPSCPQVPQPGVGKTVIGPDKEPRPELAEQAPALPGHFVTPEHRTDLQRFLEEVKSLVEHRQGGREEPHGPWPGT